jgi:hypothetical protein
MTRKSTRPGKTNTPPHHDLVHLIIEYDLLRPVEETELTTNPTMIRNVFLIMDRDLAMKTVIQLSAASKSKSLLRSPPLYL